MDWHTITAGAVGFLSGMAVTIMWAAAVVHAGRRAEAAAETPEEWERRYDAEMAAVRDERRAARAQARRREEGEEGRGES